MPFPPALRYACGLSGFFAVVLVALCGSAAGQESGFSGELNLYLSGALPRDPAGVKTAPDLFLHVQAEQGQWQLAWGKGMTISEHPGLVDAAKITSDSVELDLRMLINGDFWVKGLWPAEFKIRARRQPDGTVVGTYTGRMEEIPVAGKVHGRWFGPRPAEANPSRPPVDQHPRLLLRRQDIPALQAKLKTPLGQAWRKYAEQSNDPINLGLLYQLTGDKDFARRAGQILYARHAGRRGRQIPVFGFGSGGFGHHIFEAAVVYDLCTDGWEERINQWLLPQFVAFTERQQRVLMTSHANFHPCSNYYGPGRGVPGVVSMAVWGQKGPAPKEPRNPVAKAWQLRAGEGFSPGKGVPTLEFALGKMPSDWIWTGLLPHESSKDVLARIGGYEKARPQIGTTSQYAVKSGDWFEMVELEFQALPDKVASADGIDLGKLAEKPTAAVAVFFTTVRVDKARQVRLDEITDSVRLFISGVEITDEKFYDLHPGTHPVTLEVRTEKLQGQLAFKLVTAEMGADTPLLRIFRIRHDMWQRDMELHKRTGMDVRWSFWFRRGWFQNFQHYRWGIGDGGFKAETGGYANISSRYPSQYASMYRNFTGREVSAYPDVDNIMPRQICQAVFHDSGPEIVKLNSALSLNREWMAMHFPIVPDKYKAGTLWAWNQIAGVTGPETIPNILKDRKGNPLAGVTLAQSFINYPLELDPVHPSESMPKTWSAETFGFYVHRSGWQGDDEFVAQVFAKAAPVRGWNHPNAGAITVYGLGQVWTDAPTSRNGVREQYSVVLLPEGKINKGSCGRITHHETRPDGSGSLTIDMSDVYAAPSKGLYDGMLNRHPDRLKPSGITGLRAIGFDYSGASGAEALIVLVDKIDGGSDRLWTWRIPSGAKVSTRPGGFTMTRGGATMEATFVTPDGAEVSAGTEKIQVGDPRHGFHGAVSRVKVRSKGHFFVVLTFQKDKAPAVKVQGQGLDAKVQVGGQTVRFDGRAVRFEKK